MTIAKWEPFSFRPFFDWPNFFHGEDWWYNFHAAQGLDIYETDGEIIIEAAVPGVDVADISINIDGSLVTIQAEHREKKEEKEGKKVVHQSSRQHSFRYTATLHKPVKEDRAKAIVDSGVLKVSLPKAKKETEAKAIKVESIES